jgi:hypothetical protein
MFAPGHPVQLVHENQLGDVQMEPLIQLRTKSLMFFPYKNQFCKKQHMQKLKIGEKTVW